MSNKNLDLNILAQNRDALLLAELAAWLHDWRKCSDEHLKTMTKNFLEKGLNNDRCKFQQICIHTNLSEIQSTQGIPRAKFDSYFHASITKAKIGLCDLPSGGITLDRLLHNKQYRFQGEEDTTVAYPVLIGRVSHHRAHIEKELAENEFEGAQCWPRILRSSAFGFELSQILEGLTSKLRNLASIQFEPKQRKKYLNKLSPLWNEVIGDTRRPINEVTLWDWSSIVAALYKAELARCVLTNERREPAKIAWRLLSVRTDGLGYLFSVSSIPDLLARKRLLDDALDRVQTLLEETYPLGLEVYRDEDGSIFVVPDIDILSLNLKDIKSGKSLKELITERFGSGEGSKENSLCGEVVPRIKVDREPWKGQPAPGELPPLAEHFYDQRIKSDIQTVSDEWGKQVTDICTVCGLRPQGPGKKAASRNVCDICERRRADRSKEWATKKLHTTIWTNEVADTNGRLALVVGRFDLPHWLSGDLVHTLAVREPDDQNGHNADKVAKNPSFARLRRIWETTQRFWREVCPTDEANGNIAQSLIGRKIDRKGPRLAMAGNLQPQGRGNTLGRYHAYELVLPKGVRLSVVWDESNNRFIAADNLEYLSGETQLKEDIRNFLKAGRRFTIEEPAGYGEKNKVLGTLTLSRDAEKIPDGTYTPVIPILAEPRTSMALIPADKALQVVTAIKEKYEREMGKVRNRLPLHLGIVFAHRRTPLRALLDAGRQMLDQEGKASGWKVVHCKKKQIQNGDTLPKSLKADSKGQFKEWYEVELERDDKRICWRVSAMMGDGITEDKWYPYVFLETTIEPTDRQRRFETSNPWRSNDKWLLHVAELKDGIDIIYFAPSTFDFEYLDTTARRFEIHYDDTGRRTTRRTRPYYLEDLDRLKMLWEHMKQLDRTQRYKVISSIEATRDAWFGEDKEDRSFEDEVFRQFVRDTLAGAAWPKDHRWASIDAQEQDALIEAGVRGELADLAELHMEILKEKG